MKLTCLVGWTEIRSHKVRSKYFTLFYFIFFNAWLLPSEVWLLKLAQLATPELQLNGAHQRVVCANYVDSSFTGFDNPLVGFSRLILEVSRSHTVTRHIR